MGARTWSHMPTQYSSGRASQGTPFHQTVAKEPLPSKTLLPLLAEAVSSIPSAHLLSPASGLRANRNTRWCASCTSPSCTCDRSAWSSDTDRMSWGCLIGANGPTLKHEVSSMSRFCCPSLLPLLSSGTAELCLHASPAVTTRLRMKARLLRHAPQAGHAGGTCTNLSIMQNRRPRLRTRPRDTIALRPVALGGWVSQRPRLNCGPCLFLHIASPWTGGYGVFPEKEFSGVPACFLPKDTSKKVR